MKLITKSKLSLAPNLILFLISLVLFSCSWESDYKSAAKLSLQSDTDLILVPNPHGIFDHHTLSQKHLSHYKKETLQKIVKKYKINNPELSVAIERAINTIEYPVSYTSHYTHYNYDREIPFILYGPEHFYKGNYSQKINQQAIVPIYKSLLKLPKLEADSYFPNQILKGSNLKPEIIVTIVVDQGGNQMLETHPNSIPFIKQLQRQSANFLNAKVSHLEAHTAVGHVAIGTGNYPTETQVTSNEKYIWKDGKVFAIPIYEPIRNQWDVEELRSPSLSELWSQETSDNSITISQCYAARAAIGMAGRGGKNHFVYWADKESLQWNSSERNYTLPLALKNKNFLEILREHDVNTEGYDSASSMQRNLSDFQASAYQVQLDLFTFLNVIESEILYKNKHKDGITDLAYLTLKATDASGHKFGWESIETEKVLYATDNAIRSIFQFLEKNYGNRFVLVITADHGAALMPEISGEGPLNHQEFFERMSELLPEKDRKDTSVIKWVTHSQVSLNQEVLSQFKISKEQVIRKIESIETKGKPFFRKVWKREDL